MAPPKLKWSRRSPTPRSTPAGRRRSPRWPSPSRSSAAPDQSSAMAHSRQREYHDARNRPARSGRRPRRGPRRPDDRAAHRRHHPAGRHLRVRLGPVALPRHRSRGRAAPMGHEYVGIVEEVGSEVTHHQAWPVRRRLILGLGQHLRDLPGRVPEPLRARRADGHHRHPGRAGPGTARRRHPGRHPRHPVGRARPEPARSLRRPRHGLVRRRRRRRPARKDRRRRRGRGGRAARRLGRQRGSAPNELSR